MEKNNPNFMKGCLWGLALAIPLWIVIILFLYHFLK